MNADLTINTLSFTQRFSDKQNGSERREISRGVNLPEVMTVKHQDYVDSKTKVPGTRSVLRFDRYVLGADGKILPVSAYLVVAAPIDTNITTTDIQAVVTRVASVVNATSAVANGLGLSDEIFDAKQQ